MEVAVHNMAVAASVDMVAKVPSEAEVQALAAALADSVALAAPEAEAPAVGMEVTLAVLADLVDKVDLMTMEA